MAPRRRKDPRLPDGLRERDGYYSYTNPQDGREYGIGRDRRQAIQQALEANAALRKQPSLLERIQGTARTWDEWCDAFEKLLAEREARPNTLRTRKSQMKRLRGVFPAGKAVASITTLECASALNDIKAEGKARTAQAFRAFLIDCFDRMRAQGWRGDNPAEVTDEVKVTVRRARLSLEVFRAVYGATQIVWLRNAMALALVSGQDRDSCQHARFTDFREGGWWNERRKTGARVFLPLDLRLECFGMSLEDVRSQCRSTGILSTHLVHQTQRAKGARLGKPLHVDMITRVFSAELAKLGLDWGDKSPPTFHEIRSLSGRLYKEQGNVNPQELLGHKDPRTTAVYTDGRGEWVKVGVRK
jgi:integrase